MTKSIYKYPISVKTGNAVEMPTDAEILSIQNQDGKITIWALVTPGMVSSTFVFDVYGTGWSLPDDISADNFLSTVQLEPLVFHVFRG